MRIALKCPGSTRAKTRSRAERILHKLHIGHFSTVHFAEDREGRSDCFPQFRRRIRKATEDGNVFSFPEDNFGRERVQVPKLRHIVKRFDDPFSALACAAPRHDFAEVRIPVVERHVGYVRGAQLFHDTWISNALQKRLHNIFRSSPHSRVPNHPPKLSAPERDTISRKARQTISVLARGHAASDGCRDLLLNGELL